MCDSRGGEVWEWEEVGWKGWEEFRNEALERSGSGKKGGEGGGGGGGGSEMWVTKRPSRKKKVKVEDGVKDKGKEREKVCTRATREKTRRDETDEFCFVCVCV